MKIILLLLSLTLAAYPSTAQNNTAPTDLFTIEGAVEKTIVINLDSLMSKPAIDLDSVVITNHLGASRSVLKGLKVVPLLDLLQHVSIKVESPKQLSEYYFVLEANDGYKVVFSWNELFNSQKGREVYAIAGKEGKVLAELPDRIAIITPTDFMTGRRYVKSLNSIIIRRAD